MGLKSHMTETTDCDIPGIYVCMCMYTHPHYYCICDVWIIVDVLMYIRY